MDFFFFLFLISFWYQQADGYRLARYYYWFNSVHDLGPQFYDLKDQE